MERGVVRDGGAAGCACMMEREWRSGSAAKLRQRRRPILSALAYSKRSVLRPQFHFLNFGTQRFRVKAGKLYPFFALSEIADTSSCFFSQHSCPFFAFFVISDTVNAFKSIKRVPFLRFSRFRTRFYSIKPDYCILFLCFMELRTQIYALFANFVSFFFVFRVFGHSFTRSSQITVSFFCALWNYGHNIPYFPNRYMRRQNKIDVYITSRRQSARRSRPAAGGSERRPKAAPLRQ